MTSIEWLEEELQKLEVKYISMILEYRKEKRLIFDKAKEMHKQEIITTYIVADSESTQEYAEHNAEKYYQESFKL